MRIWAWADEDGDCVGQWEGQVPELYTFLSSGKTRWQVVAVTYCIDRFTKECTGVDLKVRKVES